MAGKVETDRLALLAGYGVLDTPPETGFDDIVALAAQICAAPVALVSLVDRDRQWFKARIGFEPAQTDLDRSICRHALGSRDILEIPDLTTDPRTRENPLVTGEPFLRFYAGAPLVAPGGQVLGTLCVIDHVPRPEGLAEPQRRALRVLAEQVMTQLALRRTIAAREAEEARSRAEAARLEAMIETQRLVAAGGRELDAVFQALVDGALRVVDAADGAAVELREGDRLVYAAVSGTLVPHRGFQLPLERTLSGRALREGQAVLCADALGEPGIDEALVRRLGVRSVIVVPVARRGEPIGVLKLQCTTPGAFSPRDLAMTQMLAGLVASALGDAAELRSRDALRQAENRYRRTFQSVTEFGVVVTDREGRILEWNTGAERVFGWTAQEVVGRDADLFFTPEDRAADRVGVEMRQSIAEGQAVDERWHLRRDGSRFYASGNMMPLVGDRGEHQGFIKIVRDRTEQHLQGRELEASRGELVVSEAKWRGLFETLQEGLVLGQAVRDASGRIVDWRYEEVNRAWVDLVGLAREEAVGRTVRELLPDIEEAWVGEIAGVVDSGETVRFTRQVGTLERWYDGVAQPLGGDRFSVIFMEVTERVQAEARRMALTELSDALLAEPAFERLTEVAAAIVGRTLQVGRAGYGTLQSDGETLEIAHDWTPKAVPSMKGTHRLSRYGSFVGDLRTGRTVAVEDARLDARTAGDPSPIEAVGARSFVNMPIVENGRTVAVLFVNDDRPRRWTEDEIAFLEGAASRTRNAVERRRAEMAAEESQKEALVERGLLKAVFRQAPMGLSIAYADGRGEINDRLEQMLGQGADGDGPYAGYGAVRADGTPYVKADYPTLRALRSGETVIGEAMLARNEETGEVRRLEISSTPVRDEEGKVLAAVSVMIDVEDRSQAEERRAILNRELSHRLKNTLAIVQSIATQTLRVAPDTATARRTLSERIGALAHAHEVLLTGHRDAAGIGEIVAGATALHDGGGRIRVEGPEVRLAPQAALALALILHELCTNAIKYGALSVPDGRIDVAWGVEPAQPGRDAILEMRWREGGGPPVETPERRSFGTRLIEMGLTSREGGEAEIHYDPRGLWCRIAAPLSFLQADEGEG